MDSQSTDSDSSEFFDAQSWSSLNRSSNGLNSAQSRKTAAIAELKKFQTALNKKNTNFAAYQGAKMPAAIKCSSLPPCFRFMTTIKDAGAKSTSARAENKLDVILETPLEGEGCSAEDENPKMQKRDTNSLTRNIKPFTSNRLSIFQKISKSLGDAECFKKEHLGSDSGILESFRDGGDERPVPKNEWNPLALKIMQMVSELSEENSQDDDPTVQIVEQNEMELPQLPKPGQEQQQLTLPLLMKEQERPLSVEAAIEPKAGTPQAELKIMLEQLPRKKKDPCPEDTPKAKANAHTLEDVKETTTTTTTSDSVLDTTSTDGSILSKKATIFRKFIGSTVRKTVTKAKQVAQILDMSHKDNEREREREESVKVKLSPSHKGPAEFRNTKHMQDIDRGHEGAIWCMKFSQCGKLLATAGQDRTIRIWVLKSAFPEFLESRREFYAQQSESRTEDPAEFRVPIEEQHSPEETAEMVAIANECRGPFMPKPLCTYRGHESDVLDVSWSKSNFLLSSSMDRSVRLWHVIRKECFCSFRHKDFVTAISFHPLDDRYFLSVSLDGRLRFWSILEKKATFVTEIQVSNKVISTAGFCNHCQLLAVGLYNGLCFFYRSEGLKYHTQIDVRSTSGRNRSAHKISGIDAYPNGDKLLVTSNDCRIRLYDLRDYKLNCKYRGFVNKTSQIKASFSPDGKYIVVGSEDYNIYLWKTRHGYPIAGSVRRDRNDYWECIKGHEAIVTCTIFAPLPDLFISPEQKAYYDETDEDDYESLSISGTSSIGSPCQDSVKQPERYVIVSADFQGNIKVFHCKTPKPVQTV